MSSGKFLENGSHVEFAKSLSCERLSTYRKHAGDCLTDALRLYTWNTAICAAFYGPLQGLEIALRNAMHRELSWEYGSRWFNELEAVLDKGAQRKIGAAKKNLRRAGGVIEPPNVVASLSFGFWVSLIDSGGKLNSGRQANYEEKLWRPALRRAFPVCKTLTRKQAHQRLNDLREFRNRIAHHEPIFDRDDLGRDHETILNVTAWISPGTAEWIRRHSRVSELLPLKNADQAITF